MKKGTVIKWVVISTAIAAVIAFIAGAAYELHTIKKLTVNIDDDDDDPNAAALEGADEAVSEA